MASAATPLLASSVRTPSGTDFVEFVDGTVDATSGGFIQPRYTSDATEDLAVAEERDEIVKAERQSRHR
jgi:hypothetical protein